MLAALHFWLGLEGFWSWVRQVVLISRLWISRSALGNLLESVQPTYTCSAEIFPMYDKAFRWCTVLKVYKVCAQTNSDYVLPASCFALQAGWYDHLKRISVTLSLDTFAVHILIGFSKIHIFWLLINRLAHIRWILDFLCSTDVIMIWWDVTVTKVVAGTAIATAIHLLAFMDMLHPTNGMQTCKCMCQGVGIAPPEYLMQGRYMCEWAGEYHPYKACTFPVCQLICQC